MNPFYRQSALRVGNGFRRLCCLLLWCAAATISQAGVYLSSYTFSSANKPYVYTNESLPSPYKLRVKIVGVPGYPMGFMRCRPITTTIRHLRACRTRAPTRSNFIG